MTEVLEFTDRYGPEGAPSLRVGCRGDCEATGWVPIYFEDGDKRLASGDSVRVEGTDARYRAAWEAAEAESPSDDGWHFVKCPDCNGTGRTQGAFNLVLQYVWFLWRGLAFARRHVFVRPYSNATAALALKWQEANVLAEVVADQTESFGVPAQPECPYRVVYGDRLDVPNPWLWNRRLAWRVLVGRSERRRPRPTLAELQAMPTLVQSHTANLKMQSETERVWFSRTGVADGDERDNMVTVERLIDGEWVITEEWEAV